MGTISHQMTSLYEAISTGTYLSLVGMEVVSTQVIL